MSVMKKLGLVVLLHMLVLLNLKADILFYYSAAILPSIVASKAFYIDSAVAGVNYQCGNKDGITATNGSFNFEEGKDCTFYIGDIKLRDVKTELLIAGKDVYESDVEIARILQSLDSDGDLKNGITIASSAIEALENQGITSLPTTEAEMNDMLNIIDNNGGTLVTKDDAAKHMYTSILTGDWSSGCIQDPQYDSSEMRTFTFNADGNASYDDKEYYGLTCDESKINNSGHTDKGEFTYVIGLLTQGLDGREAIELDIDGNYYNMIRFVDNKLYMAYGDNDGDTPATRRNDFSSTSTIPMAKQ